MVIAMLGSVLIYVPRHVTVEDSRIMSLMYVIRPPRNICTEYLHEGNHRVMSELCAHCTTDSLSCNALTGTDKECVLCILHKGSAVATRLIVSFLEALQVRIKSTMAQKRLCQKKAELAVPPCEPCSPGGGLQD